MNPGGDWTIWLVFLGFCYFFISFINMDVGLAIMAVAMLFSPELSMGGVGYRSLVIRVEDMLIIVLGLAWLVRTTFRPDRKLVVDSPLNVPIVSLLGLSLVSSVWGYFWGWVYLTPAFFYILKTTEYFMIFVLVFNYVRTEKQIKVFLFFCVLTVALIGVYTLWQVPHVEVFTENRITAPFEGDQPEPGTVGGYMAFLFLIVICLLLYEPKVSLRWLYGALAIIILVPFLYTLNRTSYMALLGGLVFIAFSEKRKKFRYVFFLLLLTSPLWLPDSVKDRIAFTWTDASNPGRELGVDYSFQERIYAFRKIWPTFKMSPLIGWGVTSLNVIDSQYARTLHEIGVIGLGLWIWIFVRLFRMSRWLFASMENSTLKGMVLGYQAGLVGILMHAFGGITFYIVRIMEPFWFMSGLVVALYLMRSREAAENETAARELMIA
ncbi:MAG: hypothetical protein HY714_01550 [Candidatus Omnitrophica bacterium]|nr:hypothetical protein [Candidatus Omnitrophota bacterium]